MLKMMQSLVSYKMIIGLALLAISIGVTLHLIRVEHVRQTVTKEVTEAVTTKLKLEKATELLKIQELAVAKTNALQQAQNQSIAELQQAIRAAAVQHQLAISRMSDRPSRPTTTDQPTVASPTATCVAESQPKCTATGLYREDAEFLVGFAFDTETLKLNLQQCYKSYDDAKQALEDFAKSVAKPEAK